MLTITIAMLLILLSIGFIEIDCLHISAEDAQLNSLVKMQKSFANQVTNLNHKLIQLHRDITSTDNLNTKISLFESAITQQRETIYHLQKQLTPSSIQSFISCQTIQAVKKQQLTQQIEQISLQIEKLEDILNDIPHCSEIQGIKREIEKMKALLSNAEDIISNNCQQMFVKQQTVYQTNLKSQSWILGEILTMEQLQDQYVQRAMRQSNITNCPITTPFYTLSECIKCPDDQHVFDMSRNICVKCQEDQKLNVTTKQCQSQPKNSNYTYGQNYVLLPLKLMPLPVKNLSSCSQFKPFFNGQKCVNCPLPYQYWNISKGKCMSCPAAQVFNLNSRNCETRVENKLTKLSNTNWVTNNGDVASVLAERVRVLQINQTTGSYQLCPDMKPYYDHIACVYCQNQFNLDTLKCSHSPPNMQYDPNMRQYLVPENNKQMDPQSPNYITERAEIVDSPIPNCNETHPYYDRIGCVYCSNPFPIFNYDINRCVACQPIEFYNGTSHKCQTRPSIYIKGNEQKLLATSEKSIADYKSQLKYAIQSNPDKIPKQCQFSTQYAAIDKCIRCDDNKGELFNVETLTCEICDGNVDPETNQCHKRSYFVTNVDANNLIIDDIEGQRKKLEQKIQGNSQFKKCTLEKPYANNNFTECIKCQKQTPYFDYAAALCVKCSADTKYNPKTHKCGPFVYLTNYSENVIIEPPKTLADYQQEQQKIKANNMTEMCPLVTPYTNDGKRCFKCSDSMPLFNATNQLCTSCPFGSKFVKQDKACRKIYYLTNLDVEGLVQEDNYTVTNVRTQQEILKAANTNIYVICPIETPFGQQMGCSKCLNEQTYFSLKTHKCEKCPKNTSYWPQTRKCQPIKHVINLQANNIVQDQQYTIAKLEEENKELAKQGPIQPCPLATPFPSETGCMQCPQDRQYFFLNTSSCRKCNNYKPVNHTCPPKPLMYPNMTNYHWISSQAADNIILEGLDLRQVPGAKQCPAFFNKQTRDCIECAQNELFNYDTNNCQVCPNGQSFDINIHHCVTPQPRGLHYTNIDKTGHQNLIYGGLTIGQLQGTQEKLKKEYPNSQYCPISRPYYDKFNCIQCPEYKKYFNLRFHLCQVCLFEEKYNATSHNCDDRNGAAIWKQPSGELVYPYLFGSR